MKLIITSPTTPFKWEMKITDLKGKVIHSCSDTQTVLNVITKFQSRLKKRKGTYNMDLTLKDYNHIIR